MRCTRWDERIAPINYIKIRGCVRGCVRRDVRGWHLWGPEVCTTTVAAQDLTSRFFKTIPVEVGTMRYWPIKARKRA